MARETQLQPAYLLHSRPFRDTSLLLEFITRDFGRQTLIARGARGQKSRTKGLLQPFIPLQISYSGKSELKSLRHVETLSRALMLRGSHLFSALYMNELMVRLIHGHEADHELYGIYEQGLQSLALHQAGVEPVLRNFELSLLDALGYGLALDCDAENGAPIAPGQTYSFQPESGFTAISPDLRGRDAREDANYFPGEEILHIASRNFSAATTRALAKKLLREVLAGYLGNRPLKSRQLFAGHR